MSGILIFLCLITLVSFILTRRIFVKIMKEDVLKIEIHFPLFALCLTERRRKKNEKAKNTKGVRGYRTIYKIITDTADRLGDCEVRIKSIKLPLKGDVRNIGAFTRPFFTQSIIYSIIAYIDTKVQKLTLYSGALISTSEEKSFSFDVTVIGRLYKLLFTALFVYRRIRRDGSLG